MKKTLLISIVCMAALLVAGDLHAQIIPNYARVPAAGQRALTPDEILNVETAIDYWEMLHPDIGPINIDFLFDAGVPPLAVACCYVEDGSGRPTDSFIRFSDVAAWYIDLTPTVNEPNGRIFDTARFHERNEHRGFSVRPLRF